MTEADAGEGPLLLDDAADEPERVGQPRAPHRAPTSGTATPPSRRSRRATRAAGPRRPSNTCSSTPCGASSAAEQLRVVALGGGDGRGHVPAHQEPDRGHRDHGRCAARIRFVRQRRVRTLTGGSAEWMRGRRARLRLALATVAIVAGLVACENRFGATLVRPQDPVVLTGAQLPKLIGRAPARVVAFAWDGDAWHQVPVQVDQRDLVNPGRIYNRPEDRWAKRPDGSPYEMLVYTPPAAATGYRSYGTFTPADRDPEPRRERRGRAARGRRRAAGAGLGRPPAGRDRRDPRAGDGPRPPRSAGGRLRLPVREPEPVGRRGHERRRLPLPPRLGRLPVHLPHGHGVEPAEQPARPEPGALRDHHRRATASPTRTAG